MDILGIGNALLDIFWFSDDEMSLSLGLHPNKASHVSPERLDEILLAVPNPICVSGGSASNAVKAASALGAATGFIGCTGTQDREIDQWARLFRDDLASFGVDCRLENRNGTSGRCLVIHMPGELKAIACAPGVAPSIRTEQIDAEYASHAKIILLDGHILRNKTLTDHIARLCRTYGIPLAIDISSVDIASSCIVTVAEFFKDTHILLFMNSQEAVTAARTLEKLIPGDREILDEDHCIDSIFSSYTNTGPYPYIIEKRGALGARLWQCGKRYEAKTDPASAVLDDTGAGDVFAGAFLRAFLLDLPIPEILNFANKAAREALSIPGTNFDRDRFTALQGDLSAYTTP